MTFFRRSWVGGHYTLHQEIFMLSSVITKDNLIANLKAKTTPEKQLQFLKDLDPKMLAAFLQQSKQPVQPIIQILRCLPEAARLLWLQSLTASTTTLPEPLLVQALPDINTMIDVLELLATAKRWPWLQQLLAKQSFLAVCGNFNNITKLAQYLPGEDAAILFQHATPEQLIEANNRLREHQEHADAPTGVVQFVMQNLGEIEQGAKLNWLVWLNQQIVTKPELWHMLVESRAVQYIFSQLTVEPLLVAWSISLFQALGQVQLDRHKLNAKKIMDVLIALPVMSRGEFLSAITNALLKAMPSTENLVDMLKALTSWQRIEWLQELSQSKAGQQLLDKIITKPEVLTIIVAALLAPDPEQTAVTFSCTLCEQLQQIEQATQQEILFQQDNPAIESSSTGQTKIEAAKRLEILRRVEISDVLQKIKLLQQSGVLNVSAVSNIAIENIYNLITMLKVGVLAVGPSTVEFYNFVAGTDNEFSSQFIAVSNPQLRNGFFGNTAVTFEDGIKWLDKWLSEDVLNTIIADIAVQAPKTGFIKTVFELRLCILINNLLNSVDNYLLESSKSTERLLSQQDLDNINKAQHLLAKIKLIIVSIEQNVPIPQATPILQHIIEQAKVRLILQNNSMDSLKRSITEGCTPPKFEKKC